MEAAQAEAEGTKAKAVGELVGSGMGPGEVAELLGISERELRALRAARAERVATMNGARDGTERQAAAMRVPRAEPA